MTRRQKTSAETRELIIAAAASLMTEGGPGAVSVAGIMRRAGISRTAFYRQFDGIYGVYADLLVQIGSGLFAETGSWISRPEAVGSPDVVHPNLVGFGRAFSASAGLLTALHDACGCDARLRLLWREVLVQPFIDATAAAIARDQAAGVVPSGIDPVATAEALTLLGETMSIELLGRRGADPEEYAGVIAPIWTAVLFNRLP